MNGEDRTTLTIPVMRVEKQLLTGAEVAAAIGVSTSGVLSLVRRRLLPPARKFGSRTRWVAADLAAALQRLPLQGERQARKTPKPLAHIRCRRPAGRGRSRQAKGDNT